MRLSRQFNSLLFPVLLFTCVVLLAWASVQKMVITDLTGNSRLSLTQPSVALIEKMKGLIEIDVYVNRTDQLGQKVEKLFSQYQKIKPDIKLNFISPEENPGLIRKHNIRFPAEMLIHYQDKTEHLQKPSEQSITNTLASLFRGSDRWLVYLNGHGERAPSGKANFDLGTFANHLQSRGLKSQILNISETKTIPDNTSVLIIANPKVDLLPDEFSIIEEYLENGGSLLWLTEPEQRRLFPKLAKLLEIKFLPGVIVDATGQSLKITQPDLIPIIKYSDHIVTKNFDLTTLFPQATAIKPYKTNHWKFSSIIVTSEQSWNEMSAVKEHVDYDKKYETLGPLNIALAFESNNSAQRIIVVGESDFLSNRYIGNGGNLDLGIRMLNWLAADDQLITIPTRVATDLDFELSKTNSAIIGLGFLYVLPLIFTITGLIIWWRRRSR